MNSCMISGNAWRAKAQDRELDAGGKSPDRR
jgi:hypothetical protein